MRIGVISDSHDRLPTLAAAIDLLVARGIDILIHPGDVVAPFAARLLARFPGQLHITYGNNDGERRGLREVLPQIQDGPLWLDLAGRRILVHHFIDWCAPADVARAAVVITGHTHAVAVERRGHQLLVNPGECCGWLTGRCTMAEVDLDTLTAQVIEVPA